MRNTLFKQYSLTARFNIYFLSAAFIIFSIVGYLIYYTQKRNFYRTMEQNMTNELISLLKVYDLDQMRKKQRVIRMNNIALSMLNDKLKKIKIDTSSDVVEVYDFVNKILTKSRIQHWKYNEVDLIDKNQILLQSYSFLLGVDIGILQKNAKGYVLINISNKSIKKAYNFILFSNSHQMALALNNGGSYWGKILINNELYFIAARPIYYKGKIIGGVLSIEPSIFSNQLKEFFHSRRYLKKGYPFIMDESGLLLVHPYLENKSIKNTKVYYLIYQAKFHKGFYHFRYKWPETRFGEYKYMIEEYLPDDKFFVGVTYYENDMLDNVKNLRRILLFAVILSSIFVFTVIMFISSGLINRMHKLETIANSLLQGIVPEKQSIRFNDELGRIIKKFNAYSDDLQENINITSKLIAEEYDYKIAPKSAKDLLRMHLIEIQSILKAKKIKEEKKQTEEKIQYWRNKSLEVILDILSTPNLEPKEIALNTLIKLTDLVHSIEGAIFLIDDNKQYLELIAALAYNKQRELERKIPIGTGLIGRVAIERKTLLITELPDDYISVNSALGELKPSNLIVIPLIYMNEIIGVIELSSVEPYQPYEIAFLEETSENIASTFANIKIAQRTSKLLEQSIEQSKQLEKQQQQLKEQIKEFEELQEESRQKEMELESIFQAIEQSAFLLEMDTDGYIKTINKSYAAIFDKTPEFFINKHFRVITTMLPDSNDYKIFFKNLKQGKQQKLTEVINLEDKSIWISHNYTPVRDKDGNIYKIFDIAFDITETKLLEKQLRQQVKEIAKEARMVRREERKIQKEREEFLNKEINYRTIIAATDEFLIRIEHQLNGIIIYVNFMLLQTLNISDTDIYDRNLKDLLTSPSKKEYNKNISLLKIGKKVLGVYQFISSNKEVVSFEIVQIPIIKKQKVEKVILVGKKL